MTAMQSIITVPTTDIEASFEFYTKKLRLSGKRENIDCPSIYVNDYLTLRLKESKESVGQYISLDIKVMFFEEILSALTENEIESCQLQTKKRMISLKTPEGMTIRLYEFSITDGWNESC